MWRCSARLSQKNSWLTGFPFVVACVGPFFFSFHLSEVQHAGYTELALPCFSRSSSAGCLILQDCGVAPVSCPACWESRRGGGATID